MSCDHLPEHHTETVDNHSWQCSMSLGGRERRRREGAEREGESEGERNRREGGGAGEREGVRDEGRERAREDE